MSNEELAAAFRAVLGSAQAGSVPALKELLDRRFGKSWERHDLHAAAEQTVKVIVEYVRPDDERNTPQAS